MTRNKRKFYTGCLLGGAVGDALGWPIEFNDMEYVTGSSYRHHYHWWLY